MRIISCIRPHLRWSLVLFCFSTFCNTPFSLCAGHAQPFLAIPAEEMPRYSHCESQPVQEGAGEATVTAINIDQCQHLGQGESVSMLWVTKCPFTMQVVLMISSLSAMSFSSILLSSFQGSAGTAGLVELSHKGDRSRAGSLKYCLPGCHRLGNIGQAAPEGENISLMLWGDAGVPGMARHGIDQRSVPAAW